MALKGLDIYQGIQGALEGVACIQVFKKHGKIFNLYLGKQEALEGLDLDPDTQGALESLTLSRYPRSTLV